MASFPFPRRYDAQVIDRLRRAGAKAIAIDLEFTQETDLADDNALIEAIGRAHGKVVLAATEVEAPHGRTDVLGGPSLLRELGARAAEVKLREQREIDTDGVARRLGYSYNGLQSFPVATAEVFDGTSDRGVALRPRHASDRLRRPAGNHQGRSPTRRSSTASSGQEPFAGKIAIVGATAPILEDIHATPTTNGGQMAGPEIWANATSTLLRGVPLTDAAGWVDVLLIVAAGDRRSARQPAAARLALAARRAGARGRLHGRGADRVQQRR